MTMDHLQCLRTFVAVAEAGSLAGAARQEDEKEGAHADEVPVLRPSGR